MAKMRIESAPVTGERRKMMNTQTTAERRTGGLDLGVSPKRPVVFDRTSPLPFRTEADRYYELLGLDIATLERELLAEIQEEHEQPERQRTVAVLSRLSAWLELDIEQARILADTWDRVLLSLSEGIRQQARDAERAAVLNGMSFADFERLAAILPWAREEAGRSPAVADTRVLVAA